MADPPPPVVLTIPAVGGSALLAFYGAEKGNFAPPASANTFTLARAVYANGNPGTFTQIYQGDPVPFYVDVGDGPSTSSQPLSASTSYVWTATDANGTTEVGPATPASSIITTPDGMTQLLIRLLQAACDNAPRPPGVNVDPVEVTTQSPTGGWPATPFVVVNLDLFQQSDVALGQDVLAPQPDNTWTLPGWSKRVWRIAVFSQNADERDFYRDTLLIAFRALKATLFTIIGMNIHHSFQATSGVTADEWTGKAPVFYFADVMYELEGVFTVTMATGFGLIKQIDVAITGTIFDGTDPAVTLVQVPPSKPSVAALLLEEGGDILLENGMPILLEH